MVKKVIVFILCSIRLTDSRMGRVLEWKTRIRIINGIAQGILYLHEALQLKIIHQGSQA